MFDTPSNGFQNVGFAEPKGSSSTPDVKGGMAVLPEAKGMGQPISLEGERPIERDDNIQKKTAIQKLETREYHFFEDLKKLEVMILNVFNSKEDNLEGMTSSLSTGDYAEIKNVFFERLVKVGFGLGLTTLFFTLIGSTLGNIGLVLCC
jgi:hypothetical protein